MPLVFLKCLEIIIRSWPAVEFSLQQPLWSVD